MVRGGVPGQCYHGISVGFSASQEEPIMTVVTDCLNRPLQVLACYLRWLLQTILALHYPGELRIVSLNILAKVGRTLSGCDSMNARPPRPQVADDSQAKKSLNFSSKPLLSAMERSPGNLPGAGAPLRGGVPSR